MKGLEVETYTVSVRPSGGPDQELVVLGWAPTVMLSLV